MTDLSRGCVLDTNILIYHLHDALPAAAEDMLADALECGAAISVISRIELLSWPQHTPDSLAAAMRLLEPVTEHPVGDSVAERTIDIRRQTRIKLGDAVIAATALDLGVPLMTRNSRDFVRVGGLVVVDPFSLPEQPADI